MKRFMNIFAAAVFLTGTIALAQSEASSVPPNISTASKWAPWSPDFTKKIYADFLTTYHGPTINKMGPYSMNAGGKLDSSALSGFDSELTTAYVLDAENEVAIGPNVPFFYEPNIPSRGFTLGDVGIKAHMKKAIKTENLQVATTAYIQAPTSDGAKQANMSFALRTTPFFIYNVPTTRWRIGSWSDVRYLNGVTEGLSVKVWVGPYINYRITDNLSFNLMYETEADRFVGDRALQFRNILADFQPGLLWQITPSMKLNPYVVLFPTNHLATDQTAVGFVFYSQFM